MDITQIQTAGLLVGQQMDIMDTHDLRLTIQNLSAGYGHEQVLQDVSAIVMPGELVALIGPNGAGKSTLIKTISGILPIQSGSIHIDGSNLLKMDEQSRARLVSVIPQARNLPPAFTTREVVLMGRTPYVGWLGRVSHHDEEIVDRAMQRTDIAELANRRMDQLSGGEQQRVLVARAIAQDPRLLLLDEPTTHLDIQYQLSFLDIIVGLSHQDQMAILMAIHDLNLAARYADRIILMVKGEIIADGTPTEVLTEQLLSDAYHVRVSVQAQPDGRTWIMPF